MGFKPLHFPVKSLFLSLQLSNLELRSSAADPEIITPNQLLQDTCHAFARGKWPVFSEKACGVRDEGGVAVTWTLASSRDRRPYGLKHFWWELLTGEMHVRPWQEARTDY